jgi:hypothetical protein
MPIDVGHAPCPSSLTIRFLLSHRLQCVSLPTPIVDAAETPPPTPLLSPLRRRRRQHTPPAPPPAVHPPLRAHRLLIPPQNARPRSTLPFACLFVHAKPRHRSSKHPQYLQSRLSPRSTSPSIRSTVHIRLLRAAGRHNDQQTNRGRFPPFSTPSPTLEPWGL